MAWFSTLNLDSLHKLFVHKVKCAYDCEVRLTEALPKMRDAATDNDLKAGFDEHLQQTRNQVQRLEQIFNRLGITADRDTDHTLKAMISVGEEIISAHGDGAVRDAALIAAGQGVEHHEMALYGSLRTWARYLGLNDVADLLQQTLDEEGEADKKLTMLAESGINAHAAH